MTSLSASALDDDPQGCALLKQAIASKDVSTEGPPQDQPEPTGNPVSRNPTPGPPK